MKCFACYVHVPGVETPHLRFVAAKDPADLEKALAALAREWPAFAMIEARDDRARPVARFTRSDYTRLLVDH